MEASAEVSDVEDFVAASGAGGEEALSRRREWVTTVPTGGGVALVIGLDGLGGVAKLTVVEAGAGGKEAGAASGAGGGGALAVGAERGERGAALVAALRRIFDFRFSIFDWIGERG